MQMLHRDLSVQVELPFDEAVSATREALRHEGFGVLTEIDVQKTLKEKIGADLQRYVILGACNPALAYSALQHDINVGLLLPCNVTVREEADGSLVSIMDPMTLSQLSRTAGIEEIARIAREKLERVVDELAQ